MKINETFTTTSTDPVGNQSQQAPHFGRSNKVLEKKDKVEETSAGATGSGSIATVSNPIGGMKSRGSIFSGVKTSSKYPNSRKAGIKENEEVEEGRYYNRDAYQRDYDSSRTGFGRRGREDDEYVNGPDKLTYKVRILVINPEGAEEDRTVTITTAKGPEFAKTRSIKHLTDKGYKIRKVFDPVESGLNEDDEPEGETLKNSLHTIVRVASDLDERLSVDEDFPEWVSEKIGTVKSMMVSVMDYLISDQEMRHDPDAQGLEEGDEQIDGMAQGEVREIIKNAMHIKKALDSGVSLDGWMYSYVTTSNDHLNSVAEQIGNPNIEEQGVAEGQRWPDDRNSLYKNDRDIELMNPKDANINWRDRKIATKIKPSITKTTVDRLDRDTTVPNFLKQGVAEGSLKEFAVEPSDGDSDDEYDLLVKLVKLWWLGTAQQHAKAEKTLASMGISIEEDDPNIILRRGKQFLTFPMDDFQQGVAEAPVNEKSKSQAQFRTMAAVAHNPKFAKKVGISQKVGKEFHSADKKSNYKSLPKKVDEGEGNLEKALDTLGGSWSGWYPDENQSDPNVKTYWYDDGEGGHYASGNIEHNLKTGQVTVDFADEYNDEVKGTFKNMGDAMRALRGGYPGSHGGKAPNFDRLGNRAPIGPDELRKTDRTGRKGTISGHRANTMKAASPGRINGPVGVLPESDISEDKLASDLYKDLQIFKKALDKGIGSKAKDKEISSKAKDKEIQKKK